MTAAEQQRLDHLEAFEREMEHLRLVAAVSLALRDNDTQELARLLGRPAPSPSRRPPGSSSSCWRRAWAPPAR